VVSIHLAVGPSILYPYANGGRGLVRGGCLWVRIHPHTKNYVTTFCNTHVTFTIHRNARCEIPLTNGAKKPKITLKYKFVLTARFQSHYKWENLLTYNNIVRLLSNLCDDASGPNKRRSFFEIIFI
jgi:hypothetical protein